MRPRKQDLDFYDFEDFEPIPSVVRDLEDHSTLPSYGLFTTQYTHETVLALDTQLTVRDSDNNVVNVGDTPLIQFGNQTIATNTVVTFGTAFANTDYSWIATTVNATPPVVFDIVSKATTSITVRARSSSSGTGTSVTANWIATGDR